ncbi:hypothetical protein C815_01477 [Firmicutes bacterium M10-2]|nr:hypothetical protein C815_01477 [Firmicutes bacterium M10-2]
MNSQDNLKDFKTLSYLCLASGIISFFMNYYAGSSLIGLAMFIYIWIKYKQRNIFMTLGLVFSLVTLLLYVLSIFKNSGLA